jgi:hypothetical protein
MAKHNVVGLIASVVMGFGAIANGAVIFQDNFSSGAESNLLWTASNDFITREFKNGECVVSNTSTVNSGYVYHELAGKPTLFTVSSKITRTNATATSGFAICFNATNFNSFIFLMDDKAVYVGKSGSELSGVASPYIDATVNVLTVSMSGTVCNVFVNNNFVTTFTYTSTPGTDIAYIVTKGTTVSFDDFVMNNEYIVTPPKRTEYVDNFENGLSKDWTLYSKAGTATVDGGKLKLKTENADTAYMNMLVNVNLTDPVGKAIFSHKGGNSTKIYGLLLEGDNTNDQATFAIAAGKYYGAVVGNAQFTIATKSSIKGKAYVDAGTGTVTYYSDTLEIIKRAGSNEYIFVANKDTLTRLTGITFPITKAGIFCQDSLDLTVDEFSFTSTTIPAAVKRPFLTNRFPLNANQSAYRGLFVFDPLGRSVIANRVVGGKASSGVYFTKGQQKSQMMMIVKNQK